MAKKPFFPESFIDQLLWLNNFRQGLPPYVTKYGITPLQVTGLTDDAEWLDHWFGIHENIPLYAQNVTAFKNEIAYGLPEGGTASVPPVFPAFPPAPTAVLPGVFTRALALANGIKTHIAYTIADGEAMGLEGAEQAPVDIPNLKPELKLVVVAPGMIDIFWKKNRTEGVEIWVKRGSGVWMLLAFDTTTPKYVDTHEFPAATETWEYKAIYHYAGARAGMWSEVVSVAVQA